MSSVRNNPHDIVCLHVSVYTCKFDTIVPYVPEDGNSLLQSYCKY